MATPSRVIGPAQPWFPPPQPPSPPKADPSALVIALLVLSGALVLGGAACLGLLAIAGSAERDPASVEPAPPAPEETTGAPLATAAPTPTGATTGTSLTPMAEEDPAPADLSDPSDPSDRRASASSAGPTPTPKPTPTATSGGSNWWCTASGSVRVCGFAGACNYQMVFGNAGGKDRFLAQMQAKNACESMARAKGSSTVCIVQCTVR